MAGKIPESPFQALEEEAYHAFREWPIWLVLRERELDAHLTARHPAASPAAGAAPEQPERHSSLDERGD